jgi:hypothetical protein
MPSAMLEQEAQMFGLRDRVFPFSGIGSPQHLQIWEFIRLCEANSRCLNGVPGSCFEVRQEIGSTFLFPDIATPNL